MDGGCKNAYDELHSKHLHAYLIFRISEDKTTIIVEKTGAKNAPYSEFVSVSGVVWRVKIRAALWHELKLE